MEQMDTELRRFAKASPIASHISSISLASLASFPPAHAVFVVFPKYQFFQPSHSFSTQA